MIAAITRWSSRRPGRLLAILGLLLVVFGVVGGGVEDKLSVGGFVDPGAESSRVEDVLATEFDTGAYGFVLLLAPHDKWVYSDENRPEGERLTAAVAADPGVVETVSFYNLPEREAGTFKDGPGKLALIAVSLGGSEDDQRETARRLHDTFVQPNDVFDIQATGAVEISRAAAAQSETDLQRAELIAAPLTLLGLLVVFRGIRAAVLPLVVALFAVLASFMALTVVVVFTDISIFARSLITALGLGLAVDYSLLMVARFREERGHDRPVELAVSRMLQTAGRTVVFSAATVGSSLVGLLVFPVAYLRSFAFAGVAVVVSAALAALLVVPPLLIKFGAKMGSTTSSGESFWGRQSARVMRHPVLWLAGAAALLVVVGIPFARLEPGRVDERVLPENLGARVAAETIRENLSWPELNPIPVLAPGLDSSDDDGILEFTNRLKEVHGVARVDSKLGFFTVGDAGTFLPNWLSEHFVPVDPQAGGTWFNVTSWYDPQDPRAEQVVADLRALDPPFGEVLVGGNTAAVIDAVDGVTGRLPLAAAVIAAVTLVLLFFMTGSVVVPLKAMVLNVLSLTATAGAIVWIFQDGHLSGLLDFTPSDRIDVFTPILMFCVAFGLSMDYEVFLLARIKEEYDLSDDNEQAVRVGIGRTGPVVTAAAVLLAIVFFSIATSSVVLLKMFGLGLAIAVLVDAFIVRATITPALMKLAGRVNWWAPGPLRRFHLRFGIWETDPVIVPGATDGVGAAPEPAPVATGGT